MDDKEREELEDLRKIVAAVDKAVKRMAKKYLKDAPRGRVHIDGFFELITLKARKIGRDKALEDMLSAEVQRRLDFHVMSYMGTYLRHMVYLPVLVRPIRNKKSNIYEKYRGYSLRGNVIKSLPAKTPEEAYENIRKDMLDHFTKTVADVTTCKQDLMEEYDMAKYVKEDVVAGFRVIVKVSDMPQQEDTDAG